MAHRCCVASSTWRNNAGIYEPTGMGVAHITEPGVLAHGIDLDQVVLPWSADLRDDAEAWNS